MQEYKRSWLWLFICSFIAVWLGIELFAALKTSSISNLRVPTEITFDVNPIWFIFVTIFKSILCVGSILYVVLFLVDLFARQKIK